jgi:hypothetical protein
MSGHLHVTLGDARGNPLTPGSLPDSPALPVWWPGRFAADDSPEISVLASYVGPADDFWLADLPIADLPPDIFASWRDLYGISLTPAFLAGEPCLISGRHGQGRYVLSYSHLETPESPQANRWLAHLLRVLGHLRPVAESIPPWPGHGEDARWRDPLLDALWRHLEEPLRVGLRHGLLFTRTNWLLGWRAGIPGANLNNLWAALGTIRERDPQPAAREFLARHGEALLRAMEVFSRGCVQYLLTERLALTLSKSLPDAVPQAMLKNQRESLFGPPMRADGLYRELMEPLDELTWLQLGGVGQGRCP